MKSGTPWSSRGIDEETREAIREAARRDGLSVSEWLNSREGEDDLAPDRLRDDEREDDAARIAGALDRLTARLRSMDAASRATVPQLVGRLDEIEQHIGRLPRKDQPGGERAHSLKEVSAMVEDLARDIDNADDEARSMVEGLRGQGAGGPPAATADASRMTEATRELDQRIAAMSGQIDAPPAQDSPSRLDDIRYQLNALLALTPKPAKPTTEASRTANIDAALRALETRIDEARARFVQPREPRAAPERPREAEQIARIEEQLAAIGNHLARSKAGAPAAATAEPLSPPRGTDLASAIAEISAHQRGLDERAEMLAMRRDQKALSAAMAALRADIATLTEHVSIIGRNGAEDQGATFDLARRIDALSAEGPVDRSLLNAIRGDLMALHGLVEGDPGRGALGTIDARIEAIANRLDDIHRKTPDRTRLDALGEEVSALRRALEADDFPRAIQRLEMRMAELGRSLEAAFSGRNTPVADPAIERLEDRLEAMDHNFAATLARPASAEGAAVGRIEGRLDEIAARIDGLLDRAPGAAAFVSIEERLAGLAESVEGLSAAQRQPVATLDEIKSGIAAIRRDIAGRAPSSTAHLEEQIRDLAARLEAATGAETEGPALAALEAQVVLLAGQLEEGQPRALVLKKVEESLDRLQAHLKDNRRESIEAARAEARAAVGELSDMVRGPMIDPDLVRALRQDLDSLRNAAGNATTQTSSTLAAVNQTISEVVDRLGRLEHEATADEVTAPVVPRVELLGPPQSAARAGMPATADQTQAEKRTGDRRADFIAAARRAAKAAATEAEQIEPSPVVEPAKPKEAKAGAFARISQAIRNRKRPLLLAAAAIVLAVGAVQLYGSFPGWNASDELIAAETEPAAPAAPHRDVPATSGVAFAVPSPADSALVAPAARPDAKIAFAPPEAISSRFSGAAEAPADDDIDVPEEPGPIVLASASVEQPPATVQGPAPDPRIGSDKLMRAATGGDAAAAFEVAARYADGNRMPKDLAKAAEWYERAANGGIAVAQYRLGSLNERGQGVQKNLTKAVVWYQRAADQGNVNAMHNLAVLMSEGVDGPPDAGKALQWFLAAGDYGVRDSQYNLGVIYARGIGTAQNLVASFKWFAIAAAQGDTDAAARRDEVAKLLVADDLAKARAAVEAWHAKPPLAEANGVSAPDGGWDGPGDALGEDDRLALVKKIQTLLAGQGFDPGPADGVVGQKTRDALRAYQRKNGIAETGQIDNKVIASLTERPM